MGSVNESSVVDKPQTRASLGATRAAAHDWRRLASAVIPGLATLQRLHEDARDIADPIALVEFVLRGLEVDVHVEPEQLDHIPAQGATVIVANHPFGGLDGLAAIATIGRRRRDLRVLANPELARLEGLSSLMIPIDPFGGARAKRANVGGLRQALRWLEKGGTLLVFPAGEVSHLDVRAWAVTDPPWSVTAARLLRLSGAAAVPMYFSGANSALFQVAGMLHPRLRTLLLPNELANKAGTRLQVRIGKALDSAKLRGIENDESLCAHLRLKTYALAGESSPATRAATSQREREPVAPPVSPDRLEQEIDELPAESLLLKSGRLSVYCARAAHAPWILQELGRLRELTFRGVGEGTGRSADIDVFDDYYEHLFVWNTQKREIIGAYRLGRTDEISARLGKRGLYTSTLFDFNDLFLPLLGPALELGRSFVRAEYQKSFAPLLLLWKGIGEYVGRHPRYCRLIGPVSISNDYGPLSRDLLVDFLRRQTFELFAPAYIRPKQPFRGRFSLRALSGKANCVGDIDALSALVEDLEPDGKGAPVLLRQYLKLGGRMLGFNVDPQFGNALDCLVLVDLRKTPARALSKYMSTAAWESFCAKHPPRRQ